MTKKISALTAASSAAAANEYEINEAGTSKKVTGTQVAAMVQTAIKATAENAKDTTNTTTALTPASLNDVRADRLLWQLLAADFNVTTDQAFTKVGTFTNFMLLNIRVVFVSGASLTLAAGGIYTAISKGGTAIVNNTQTFTSITGAGKATGMSLNADGNAILSAAALYLSLTTAQGSAAVENIYIFGHAFD